MEFKEYIKELFIKTYSKEPYFNWDTEYKINNIKSFEDKERLFRLTRNLIKLYGDENILINVLNKIIGRKSPELIDKINFLIENGCQDKNNLYFLYKYHLAFKKVLDVNHSDEITNIRKAYRTFTWRKLKKIVLKNYELFKQPLTEKEIRRIVKRISKLNQL